jgi:hypothetical protein
VNQQREKRTELSGQLQQRAIELEALAQYLRAEDRQNGWHVRYGYVDQVPYPPLTVLVMIAGVEFARFVRDEGGILGLFEDGKLHRFSNRHDAFEATVKQRMARQNLRAVL